MLTNLPLRSRHLDVEIWFLSIQTQEVLHSIIWRYATMRIYSMLRMSKKTQQNQHGYVFAPQ